MKCAWCGSTTWTALGQLGRAFWYRCRFCGQDSHSDQPIELDPWGTGR